MADEAGVTGDGRLKERRLVLIVEDEPNNRAILQTLVQDFLQTRAVVADDGQQALAAVAHERPDVILLDLMMPVMDGLTLARRLKGDPATAGIPIVALTALARTQDERLAMDAGCDAFIAKPFDLEDVERVVRRYLDDGTAAL